MTGRIVTPEEARVIAKRRDDEDRAVYGNRLIDQVPDLAYTVEQQGQQIAAVKALHSRVHCCEAEDLAIVLYSGSDCPTARALGVS